MSPSCSTQFTLVLACHTFTEPTAKHPSQRTEIAAVWSSHDGSPVILNYYYQWWQQQWGAEQQKRRRQNIYGLHKQQMICALHWSVKEEKKKKTSCSRFDFVSSFFSVVIFACCFFSSSVEILLGPQICAQCFTFIVVVWIFSANYPSS